MTEPERPVLLYDGDCALCRFAVGGVRKLDPGGSIALVPLRDDAAGQLLAEVPAAERLESVRLAGPDGVLLDRGPAVVALARLLGAPVPRCAGPLLTPVYNAIARRRRHLFRAPPFEGRLPHTSSPKRGIARPEPDS
jgi:predicted DCC family thiol-disulfide oxidoreductase YuxK